MKHRHRILVMLSLLSMVTFLDRVCISVAGPRIQREFSISLEHWGWVVGAFSLAYSLFEIPTGMMGDRFGSRRVLTRIVLWWSAFTAFTGMVSGYGMLVAVRFLFGVGEAGAFPNISAVISRWFPPEERARSQGWVWTATRLGAALSPVLVVPITAVWGWRATFWIFGSIGVVWAVVWHSWYRDSPAESPGISQAELHEISNRPLHATNRLSLATAFKHPTLRVILLMYFCYCYAAYFFISWLHTYLVRARAFTDKDLAVLSTLPFLFGAAANLAGGFIGDHLVKKLGLTRGRRTMGVAGLSAAGLLVLAAPLAPGKWVILLLALAYASSDFMLPSAWAICVDVGGRNSGAVSGAMNTAGQLGSLLSGVAFGYIVHASGSYDAPLMVIGVMLLISAALWLRIDPIGTPQSDSKPVETLLV
jgi:MFS transporter, ACS family, glucarate transporter